MKKLTIGIILVAVVGVLFLELFTFVARPYQTVLIDRFGKNSCAQPSDIPEG